MKWPQVRVAVCFIAAVLIASIGGCPGILRPERQRPDDHADSASGATALNVDGSPVAGEIETEGDVDFFYFQASSGCTYTISTGGSIDTHLQLYASDGRSELAQDDDGGPGTLSRIEWDAESSGRLYVKVRHFSSSSTGSYTVSVSESHCGGSATLIVNTDSSSRHIAQATAEDGNQYDYWVQRDDAGRVQYLSDLRVRRASGDQYYFQWDEIGRPTYFQDASGASVRVHFYLEDDQADVTITLPSGESARGIVNLGQLIPADGASKRRLGAFTKDGWASGVYAVAQRKDPQVAQMTSNDIADFCSAANRVREGVCSGGGSLIGALVLLGTCAGLGELNILAGGAFTTGVIAACSAATNPIAQEITGAFVCQGLRIAFERCEHALQEPLGEPDPPVSPSTTGSVTLHTGTVHITLTWDNATDVDLHVSDPFGEEIYYGHPTSASGGQLDVDDIDGYGPENIFWSEAGAPEGEYTVAVVYYNSYGRGPSTYEVTVRYPALDDGHRIVETYSGTLTSSGEEHIITSFSIGAGSGGNDVYPESPHPYANNYDNEWTYTLAGSHSSIDVTFDAQTETESCCDFIYVMDAGGNGIPGSPFSGTELAGRTVNVPGSTVRIRLSTDFSVTRWGFRVTDVRDGG